LKFTFRDINPGCHGIPERCLVIGGKRMTICARCFGSIIGHCAAFVCLLTGALPPWYIAIILFIPIGVDWGLQQFFGVMSTNFRRLITGIIGGFGVGALIWAMIRFVFVEYVF
jgi:uncharacterized membrane protein